MTSAKGQCSFFKNRIVNLNTNINDSVDYEKAVEALGQVQDRARAVEPRAGHRQRQLKQV